MSNIISFKDNKYTNVDSYNNDNKNINDDCDKLSNSIKTNNNNNTHGNGNNDYGGGGDCCGGGGGY